MFKFLKEKISKAIANITNKIDEEAEEVKAVEEVSEPQKKEAAKEMRHKEAKKPKHAEKKHKHAKEEKKKEKHAEKKGKAKKKEEKHAKKAEKKHARKKKHIEEAEMPVPKEDISEEEKPEIKAEEKIPEEKRAEKKPELPPKKKGFFSAIGSIFQKKAKEEKPAVEEEKAVIEERKPEEKVPEEEKAAEEIPEEEKKEEKPAEEEKAAEEIPEEEKKEEKPEEKKEPVGFYEPKEEDVEKVKKEVEELEKEAEEAEKEEAEEEEKKEKTGFFGMIAKAVTMKKISENQFDGMFEELEITMLENNVAVEVIDKIKTDLKKELVEKPIKRGDIENTIMMSLRKSLEELFTESDIDLIKMIEEKKAKNEPLVICFLGINGSGKTTTIAKMAQMMLDRKYSVVLAAADTFRAAAIDQLQVHADNLGVKMIKHDYGSDPAAVAFDAIKHAQAKKVDVVLIDTAGRMHSNANLQDEMKKIVRVAKPDLKIFVGESITGNDCVEQAKTFDQAVNIDGIILSKADVDEKGGAAISISYVTHKPILFIGTGQEYKDIKPFNSEEMIEALFS